MYIIDYKKQNVVGGVLNTNYDVLSFFFKYIYFQKV